METTKLGHWLAGNSINMTSTRTDDKDTAPGTTCSTHLPMAVVLRSKVKGQWNTGCPSLCNILQMSFLIWTQYIKILGHNWLNISSHTKIDDPDILKYKIAIVSHIGGGCCFYKMVWFIYNLEHPVTLTTPTLQVTLSGLFRAVFGWKITDWS